MNKFLALTIMAATAFSAQMTIDTNVAHAKKVSCGITGNLKSVNSNRAINVRFVNNTKYYRAVYWIDYSGNTVFYKALNPGQSYTQSTYSGHPWMVTNGPGDCRRAYVPKKSRTYKLGR